MYYFKALWKISILLISALFIFGCVTSENQTKNAEFSMSAESVPEGILLTINNIPADVSYMWLHVTSFIKEEELIEGPYDMRTSFASITDGDNNAWYSSTFNLETIKKTGKILFPVFDPGVKHLFSVHVYNEQEFYNRSKIENFIPRFTEVEFIPNNSILSNRDDVKIFLNETFSVVSIITEPLFSSELIFDDQKYNFGVNIFLDDGKGIGIADYHFETGVSPDRLSWEFEPLVTNTLREDVVCMDWLESSTSNTAWAEVRVNIISGGVRWSIEIAKSPLFSYSL
ncbi:MAG: hypothetical protein FWD47_14020 [Treponema sp.]|nr:hypothetical protein [Treponema sp.]